MGEMTWHPSVMKLVQRKEELPPLGLRNLGNSCYLNSVVQCLTFTPPLADFCLQFLHSSNCDLKCGEEKPEECPFCILEKRIARSLCSEAESSTPSNIHTRLHVYAEHFRPGRQEDAHEFLRYVVNACHNACLRLNELHQKERVTNGGEFTGSRETVIKEIFGGALLSQLKCLSCEAESNKVDQIMDISLDILNTESVTEALWEFFQPEVLLGTNSVKCDNCKALAPATKKMSVYRAPNVLVIQLKRFDDTIGGKIDRPIELDDAIGGKIDRPIELDDAIGGKIDRPIELDDAIGGKIDRPIELDDAIGGKIDRPIEFDDTIGGKIDRPIELDDTTGGKIDRFIEFDETLLLWSYNKPSEDQCTEYNLFGAIVHSGSSADCGHYYAYIKDAYGRWYCCNDAYVSVSSLQEVLSEKVYILFYSCKKQTPEAGVDDTVTKGSNLDGSEHETGVDDTVTKGSNWDGSEPAESESQTTV